MNLDMPAWPLTDELIQFIVATFFAQPRPEASVPVTSALVQGRLPGGQVYAWLYTTDRYYSISLEDHEKFKQASKSRGGSYTIELCEFEIEEVLSTGNIVLNFWRRTRDDTGEGGRVVLTRKHNSWKMLRRLKGWRSHPE